MHGWELGSPCAAARARADAELLAPGCRRRGLPGARDELVADEHRLDSAASLTDVVHASDERFLPGASPLDRGAVARAGPSSSSSRARLCDLDRPVTPRGVLLVERLLADTTARSSRADRLPRSSGHGHAERSSARSYGAQN